MASRTGRALLSDSSLRNHFAARYLNVVVSSIPREDQVPIGLPETRAEQLAAELALGYLTQCRLSQTAATATTESASKISAAHRFDWPARVLSLSPGGGDLGKLCRLRLATMIGQAVGRPRYRLISDDGRTVIGCLVISDETYNEFRIEDEVGEADIDARLLEEMRRNAKTETQSGARKVGDVTLLELSEGDDGV
jgi:hypothetical protein